MQEKTLIIIFFVEKKIGMNQPNAFWACGPKMLQMKFDHTKGAIYTKTCKFKQLGTWTWFFNKK